MKITIGLKKNTPEYVSLIVSKLPIVTNVIATVEGNGTYKLQLDVKLPEGEDAIKELISIGYIVGYIEAIEARQKITVIQPRAEIAGES